MTEGAGPGQTQGGEAAFDEAALSALLKELITRPGRAISLEEELFERLGQVFPDSGIPVIRHGYRARMQQQWDTPGEELLEPIEPLEGDAPETFFESMQFAADICERDILCRVEVREFIISPSARFQPAE